MRRSVVFWASLVPSQTILTNTAPYFIFSQGGVREQAFVLGLLNSSILDWIGHTKINLHLNYFILNSFPMPEMLADAKTSRFIELSAGLAIAGSTLDRFGNWPDLADPIRENERPEAIAELDAIASLLYELPDEFIKTIWNKPTRPEPELIRTYRAKSRD